MNDRWTLADQLSKKGTTSSLMSEVLNRNDVLLYLNTGTERRVDAVNMQRRLLQTTLESRVLTQGL